MILLHFFSRRLLLVVAVAVWLPSASVFAQTNLAIYTDHLVNGFQDWSWAPRNLANTSPVHSGTNSIAVNASLHDGIAFHYQFDTTTTVDVDTSIYASFGFWAHGGANGGQLLQVYATLDNTDQAAFTINPLVSNTWVHVNIPLSLLHANNKTNLSRITLQLTGGRAGTYYLDDVELVANASPAMINLGVDAQQTLRAADARWFGVNTATWDGYLSSTSTIPLLKEMGIQTLRWPGGSTSDNYHWASDIGGNVTFMHVATNIGARAFITVNYGSGTSNEAAGWVKYFNLTNHCAFKYWEIGNENYGTWENDTNALPHDPFTYATRARDYIALMKAADPTIRCGVVVVPGENTYSNNANHFAVNPVTGTTNYGWTPVMLSTLKSLGVTPDFLIYHYYAQYTAANWAPNSPESDPLLLQAAANWAVDAADLRGQITDYLGAAGAGIELVCTENNSDAGSMGAQSTSVVNALYLADSLSRLMKTEFNSCIWWDLRNGSDQGGVFDPTLYGWRTFGDYGLLNGPTNRMPTFYAEKLLQYFVRPGDTIVNASSDNITLSTYASRKADGALAILVINKTPTNFLNARISLTNFAPASVAITRAYGVAQDNDVRTGNPNPAAQDISTNTLAASSVFTNLFPPYTMTLLTFAPTPGQITLLSVSANQAVMQLHGQPGAPYVLQSTTNLISSSWTSLSTNLFITDTMTVTNAISANVPRTYWRTVWEQ